MDTYPQWNQTKLREKLYEIAVFLGYVVLYVLVIKYGLLAIGLIIKLII